MLGAKRDSVIRSIYASAVAPELWEAAIVGVTRLLGGVGATVEVHDRTDGALTFFSEVGMPEKGAEMYVGHYHTVCPRLPWGRDMPAGTAIYDYMFLTEREMSQSEFYTDFLAPFDFRYLIGGTIRNDADELAVLAVHRLEDRGHASESEIELTRELLGHLHQARHIERELRQSGAPQDALAGAVGALTIGLVLIDPTGAVVFANREALRLAGSGVLQIGERLVATASRDRRAVDRLLAGASGDQPQGGVTLIGLEQARPISVTVVPAPAASSLAGSPHILPPLGPEQVAVVYLADPSRQPALSARALRAAYGLTPAETKLAIALARGADLSEYAEAHGISRHTARALLARARAKLGATSQRELVRLLLALAPPIEPPP